MSDPFIGVTYDIISQPPALDPPTGLTVVDGGNGAVFVTLVQPTVVTTRGCFVEMSLVTSDWTNVAVIFIPFTRDRGAFQVGANGTVYVRARAVDMWGNVSAWTSASSTSISGISSGPGIWRPLMDGLGNVVTDGANGEAIMAFE